MILVIIIDTGVEIYEDIRRIEGIIENIYSGIGIQVKSLQHIGFKISERVAGDMGVTFSGAVTIHHTDTAIAGKFIDIRAREFKIGRHIHTAHIVDRALIHFEEEKITGNTGRTAIAVIRFEARFGHFNFSCVVARTVGVDGIVAIGKSGISNEQRHII